MRIDSIETCTDRTVHHPKLVCTGSVITTLLAVGILSIGCLDSSAAGGAGFGDPLPDDGATASVATRSANVTAAAPHTTRRSRRHRGTLAPETPAPQSPSETAAPVTTPDVPVPPAPSAAGGNGTPGAADPSGVSSGDPGQTQPGPAAHAASTSTLGYNMDFPGDWTNMPPFIDQMKNARAVQGECSSADPSCDPARHLDLDENGWVRSLRYKDDASRSYSAASVIVTTSSQRPDIGQTFVVTWEGNANVQIQGAGNVQRVSGERRLTFVLGNDNTVLTLRDIDAAAPARNIRMFRADQEQLLARGEIFSPDMLAFLEPFGSLRFMDWMQSNARGQCSGGSETGRECYAVTQDDCGGGGVCLMPGHWAERPTSDRTSYLASGQYLDTEHPELGTKVGGYPVEIMVALANRTGKNPHFNMPADFDADYVRSFADYVREHLGPGLRASVEYSNEVWNWGFPQAGYANTLGHEMWPDEGSAWVQYAAGRTSEMCRLWKEEFAGEEGRMRCLISPQTDWQEMAQTVLECPAWVASHPGSGPCYEYADAISITGYFSGCLHENESVISGWLGQGKAAALDLAFEQLEHGGLIDGCESSLDDAIATYQHFDRLAQPRGLELYVYESGTHFAYDADDSARQFLVDMTRDERMYDVYRTNFAGFRLAGGGMFNVWGWVARDDAWANAESVLQRNHPKYRAIADFARDGEH